LAADKTGNNKLAKMAMMAITTSNSTNENPAAFRSASKRCREPHSKTLPRTLSDPF